MTRLPDAPSQVIQRDTVLHFTFDGQAFTAYEGDTIASALAAAGVDDVQPLVQISPAARPAVCLRTLPELYGAGRRSAQRARLPHTGARRA